MFEYPPGVSAYPRHDQPESLVGRLMVGALAASPAAAASEATAFSMDIAWPVMAALAIAHTVNRYRTV